MKAASFQPAIWHVVFNRDIREFSFDWMNPCGFRHVFCFGYCPIAKTWVVYDASLNGVDLKVIPAGDAMAGFYQKLLEAKSTIVRVRAAERSPAWRHRVFFTCVTGVKQIIRSPSGALRPIGLFRDLLREGAQIVFWRGEAYESEAPEGRPAIEGAA